MAPHFRFRLMLPAGIVATVAALAWLAPRVVNAQNPLPDFNKELKELNAIPWQHGPATATIGNNLAQVKVPAGYKFTGRDGAVRFLERVTQNTTTPRDQGILI